MPILNIAPATRAGAHLLISLFGPPESGKTYSALMLAAGMAPDPRKRILLDTESGRGRLYAEDIPGGYDYAELTRPFTPERYVEALLEIEAAGYEVAVIDSISHVWAGEGGVLEQADRGGGVGLQKWLAPKLAYRKLTNRLLASRMHMILCSRAKQPMIEGRDPQTGKKTLLPGPWIEVQDKSLRYEMTVILEMTKRGAFSPTKVPGPLDPVFGVGGTVGTEMGKRVAAWVAGGAPRNLSMERLHREAEDAAAEGMAALKAWTDGLAREDRAAIKPHIDNYKSIAAAADAERERLAQEEKDRQGLDDPFTPATSAPAAPDPRAGTLIPDDADPFWRGDSLAIPLPAGADDQIRWAAWEKTLRSRADDAPNSAALDMLEADNRPALEQYAAFSERSAQGLRDFVAFKRAALSHGRLV